MKVADIMSRSPITIGMDAPLERVKDMFERYRFHHVLVIEDRKLVGVVSDRDLLKHVSPFVHQLGERPQDQATLRKPVHQVMTRKPVTVTPETEVNDAALVMLKGGVSCLPVVDEDQSPVGLLTWRDLLRAIAGEADGPTGGGS